jgi:glycosyltransferase involved in cell wall biosynthesis
MFESPTGPRITIVTPCLNGAAYLAEAMDSVLGQGYPNLEYIIVDGGSTDGSVEIIKEHAAHLTHWVSEPDRGHAHALNKGFARTTGDIMGWLNADDVLHRGSLRLLAEVFTQFPQVEGLTGQASHLDEAGAVVDVHPPRAWSRLGFLSGDYRWIQQEGTYWRRGLWHRAGGRLSEEYRLACDFELWVRFFRHAQLQSTSGLIGGFRFHARQRTAEQIQEYEAEAQRLIDDEIRVYLERGLPPAGDALWVAAPPRLEYDWRSRALRFAPASGLRAWPTRGRLPAGFRVVYFRLCARVAAHLARQKDFWSAMRVACRGALALLRSPRALLRFLA